MALDCKVLFGHTFFWEILGNKAFVHFFLSQQLGSISLIQGSQLERDRDKMLGLSKLRFNVDCGQINETTEISIDCEDNQKDELKDELFVPSFLPHLENLSHQISNYNLE